jgi:ABC-2 type transport system permease protein
MSDSSPLNRRVLTVARREFLARVRSRWFLFSTLVIPLLFVGAMVLPAILVDRSTSEPKPLLIVDETQERLSDRLIPLLEEDEVPARRLPVRAGAGGSEVADLDSLRSRILEEDATGEGERAAAWLYLPRELLNTGEATLVEDRETGPLLQRSVSRALREVVTTERLERAGVTGEAIEEVLRPTSVEVEPLRVEDGPAGLRQALGFVFAMALYVMFIVYGQMIARGVLEEKTSDIVEILVSSLRPWEMMLGKILGIGAVGLSQVAIWVTIIGIASMFGLASAAPALAELGLDLSRVSFPWDLVLWSMVFFFTGYLLYSGVFAAAGAMVTSEQDIQQVLIPALIPIVLPILVLPAAMQTPDATWVVVMSLIPFFSPILMPMRIASSHVPLWQILLAVVVLLVTTYLLARAAGRIYRMGILMKGKRPNLPEFMRWIRHG